MDLTLILIICGIVVAVAFCFCLAVANFAPDRFMDIYKKYIDEEAGCQLTPVEVVNEINQREFHGKLRVHAIDKLAGDAYVRGGDLLLSNVTLTSTSLASYAVLAHEFGHALQDRDTNKLKVFSRLIRLGRILGFFMFPSLIAGIILIGFGGNLLAWGIGLVVLGALVFILALAFKLFTISIEKDASKKAIILLKEYFTEKQIKSIKKLLNSAKLCYWASFFRTLLGWTFLTKKAEMFY